MVQPSGEGAGRCMQQALATVDTPIDYINAHGTSTPVGDIHELEAVRDVFGSGLPHIAFTKSLTGHALGAAGVNEAICSLLMMEESFIAASANINDLDRAAEGFPIVRELQQNFAINCAMSNSLASAAPTPR
jgi:3-oxoacyl-[acyl-carrier-protein] synthase-1